MNGFRKSKGIVIELTALLDVILIMLFWVMMNTQSSAEKARETAEQAQEQVQAERKRADSEIEEANREAQQRIDEALKNADSEAWENRLALEEYENGGPVTLNIWYDTSGGHLDISCGEVSVTVGTDTYSAAEGIRKAFDELGIGEQDVALCAVVYDGNGALYRDVESVTAAVEKIRESYEGIYCAYINTSK